MDRQSCKKICYCRLLNKVIFSVPSYEVGGMIRVLLPDSEPCDLKIEPDDERTLVCVDGGIPTAGLSVGSEVIKCIPLGTISCLEAQAYKRALFEEEPLFVLKEGRASQKIDRIFALLNEGKHVLWTCDCSTLRRRYVIVQAHYVLYGGNKYLFPDISLTA